ncbi:MAG: inner membrane-spanning protein YciB [Phenylobacterium sp.]|uniref:inner membrane-spanning protein YciB n=1 Tax=Phenylobacterium sp. TaxID=1871053 RepID=UPI00271EFBEA|nr:inner membrane-spanning protein YciB [Phenylobacterium sp.]MDO8900236.1 inner membrane-spanning protein YciB [Phenylobacterium sp.]MDP2215468.1 inner membrane-spanning protein YciB [Phenylobacterium sp.]
MTLSPSTRRTVRFVVDYGGLIAFLVGFFLSGRDMIEATKWLVAASAVALLIGLVVERRIAPIPAISGGAALVFGGLTLWFDDPVFVKIKPTIMNLLFATGLLGGLALGKSPLKMLMGSALQLPDEVWRKLTLSYGLFFAAVAVLNEVIWRTQSDEVWVLFRMPGLPLLAVAFSLSQVPLMMKYAKTDEPPPPPPPG